MVPSGRRTFARRASLTFYQICLQYYNENDVFFSPEGILKMISIICFVVLSVLSLCAGACARAPALPVGAASVALAGAGSLVLVVAARALHLPRKAPYGCFIAEVVVCSASGALALVTGALRLALCRAAMDTVAHYVQAGIALAIAGLLITSASLAYWSVMRLWDVAAKPVQEPRTPSSLEHDV